MNEMVFKEIRGPRKGHLPEYIDSTMRSDYTDCGMKFYYRFVLGITPRKINIHLNAGKAFAVAQEVFRKAYWGDGDKFEVALGRAAEALIKAYGDPEDYADVIDANWMGAKSLDSMLAALARYYIEWHPDIDRLRPYPAIHKVGAEFSFSHEIDVNHPSGRKFTYVGKFDMLGQIFDTTVVVDEKTAKQLGKGWAAKWQLRGQFTGYVWGARKSGIDAKYAIVRGISAQKGDIKCEQAIVSAPPWKVERWHGQLLQDVKGIVRDWEEGTWGYALNDRCADFGGCPYQSLCSAPNPEPHIKAHFDVHFWDPLAEEKDDS